MGWLEGLFIKFYCACTKSDYSVNPLFCLQCILIGIGLIYYSMNKIAERRKRIRELEAIYREQAEKLLDIEGNFKEFVPLLMV